MLGSLSGLLRTVTLEGPEAAHPLVDCLDGAAPALVAERLHAETSAGTTPGPATARAAARSRRLTELTPVPDASTTPASARGGGVPHHRRRRRPRPAHRPGHRLGRSGRPVALTGRSALDDNQRQALDDLRAQADVEHRQTDITDRADVARLVAHITRTHGALTGVVHAARACCATTSS